MSDCCRCLRGPIGPQGPAGNQGRIRKVSFSDPVIIDPNLVPYQLKKFEIRNPNPNSTIISFGYNFVGDLTDIGKIRISTNTSEFETIANIDWKFYFFITEAITTKIELFVFLLIYRIPPSPSPIIDHKIIMEIDGKELLSEEL